MTDDTRRLYGEYGLIAAVVFVAAHGLALSVPLLNQDDWAHVAINQALWGWAQLGRWGQDIVYHLALGSSFSHSAQAVGGLSLFLLLPVLLLTRRERTLASLAALFAVGTSFPYWVDGLNFSSHVLTFPLTLVLSVSAFRLACEPRDGAEPSSIVFRSILGGLLFFVALATYQPLGAFGVIVPLLFAFRVSQVNRLQLTRLLISASLVVVIGAILYVALYKGYFAALPSGAAEDSRAGFASPYIFGLKLADLPARFTATLTGGALGGAHPLFPAVQLAAGAALVLIYLAVVSALLTEKRLVDCARVVVFVPLALLIPVFGPWLVVKVFPWYPPRALAGFNFAFAAVILVLLFEYRAVAAQGAQRWAGRLQAGVLVILWAGAIGAIAASSKLWMEQWRVSQRDVALSTAIFSVYAERANQHGGHLPKLILVGGSQYEDIFHEPAEAASSVARSAFGAAWSRTAIFHELFRGRVEVQLLEPELANQSCEAFPGKGSVHRSDDDVIVCLERVIQADSASADPSD